jgi:peptide alpha-N-acetyltransferase
VIICKLEPHRSGTFRGYIAMLAVQESHRGRGIASKLVKMAIEAMTARDADEVVLETEVTNTASLKLYERLGFIRSKRLHRYYLNGNAAFRLMLYLKEGTALKRPAMGATERMEEESMAGMIS